MGPRPAPSRLRRTEVGIAPNEPPFSTAARASARIELPISSGHSRVSMSLDFYLGRKSADPRVLAALEAADPMPVHHRKR